MKLEILKENLKGGLGVVERVTGKNITLPILDNVFLKTEDSFLNLIATNLETTIKLWVLTKVIKKGSAVVPAKFLSSFIASLPNEKIIIEEKNQNLSIECVNYKTQVRGFNPEDFPIIPEFRQTDSVQIEGAKLCQAISQVIDVPMPSQSRPEISGIYFSFSNVMKVAATDSFRLAEKIISLDKPAKKEHSFILPQKPARDVIGILEGKEGMVTIYFSENQAMFEFNMKEVQHPQVQIISRLIEGEYPNYQEIIPTKFKTNTTIKRDEFLNQIKAASFFASKTNEIKVSVNPEKGEVHVLSQAVDVGDFTSSLPAKITGEQVEVSFNYKYVLDGLLNMKSSEINFQINKEDGPCILKPVGDSTYLYVVMPIKPI